MKLYKKDSKGKIRSLEIKAENNKLIQISGLVDGKKVTNETICKPKNVGKSNQTTDIEQAKLEANAKIVKKIKEGYFYTKKEAEESVVILPMLAKSYDNYSHKIDWSCCYVQPKLDGMRCLANSTSKISRKNTPITTMDHIKYEGNLTIDGELYAHGLSFQDNMKAIKKISKNTHLVKFHIYDIVSKMPFKERLVLVKGIAQKYNNIELVPTFQITSQKELQDYHKKFLSEGYEGTIVRWGNSSYKINGRSENLLKYKDFQDIACKIVDIGPSSRRPTWGRPVVQFPEKKWILKTNSGIIKRISDTKFEVINGTAEYDYPTFSCGTKMSHKDREDLLTNKDKYIGKTAEIRYFELTDSGIPRFPVMCGIRLDK